MAPVLFISLRSFPTVSLYLHTARTITFDCLLSIVLAVLLHASFSPRYMSLAEVMYFVVPIVYRRSQTNSGIVARTLLHTHRGNAISVLGLVHPVLSHHRNICWTNFTLTMAQTCDKCDECRRLVVCAWNTLRTAFIHIKSEIFLLQVRAVQDESSQRYSAPQSPITVIILWPFERSNTASISAISFSESRMRKTFRLSSGCSDIPNREPIHDVRFRHGLWYGDGTREH